MKVRGRDMRLVWTVAVDVNVTGTVLMPMLVDMEPSDPPIDVECEPDQHHADDSLEHFAGHLWNRPAEHEMVPPTAISVTVCPTPHIAPCLSARRNELVPAEIVAMAARGSDSSACLRPSVKPRRRTPSIGSP
jgi:hypothetical protein